MPWGSRVLEAQVHSTPETERAVGAAWARTNALSLEMLSPGEVAKGEPCTGGAAVAPLLEGASKPCEHVDGYGLVPEVWQGHIAGLWHHLPRETDLRATGCPQRDCR